MDKILIARIDQRKGVNRSPQTTITFSTEAIKLFTDKTVVLSYDGLTLKVREATLDDRRTLRISNRHISAGIIHDHENWNGKYLLVRDGDWYIFEKLKD